MSNHSPGPWQMKVNISSVAIYAANGASITRLPLEQCSIDRCTANARLMVAAPDMLIALRKAVVLLAGACVHLPELAPHETYEAVSAAIAKATGASVPQD